MGSVHVYSNKSKRIVNVICRQSQKIHCNNHYWMNISSATSRAVTKNCYLLTANYLKNIFIFKKTKTQQSLNNCLHMTGLLGTNVDIVPVPQTVFLNERKNILSGWSSWTAPALHHWSLGGNCVRCTTAMVLWDMVSCLHTACLVWALKLT